MDYDEIFMAIDACIKSGFTQAVRLYEPTQDLIRATRISAWLRMNDISRDTFRALEKQGKLRSFRKGDAKNSPLYYSKAEVLKALSAAKTAALITKHIATYSR